MVIVLNYGHSTSTIGNKSLISNTTNGNSWFCSPRADGASWQHGMGGSAALFIDGNPTTTAGSIPQGTYYNNKWSVWIINNLILSNGNISFLGFITDL